MMPLLTRRARLSKTNRSENRRAGQIGRPTERARLPVDTFAAPNPDFQIGERAPLSINPRNTPGLSPGFGFIAFSSGKKIE
jgi:hypothetical protein